MMPTSAGDGSLITPSWSLPIGPDQIVSGHRGDHDHIARGRSPCLDAPGRAKLAGPIDAVRTEAATSLRIAPVTPQDAVASGDAVFGTLGLPDVAAMMADSVGGPNTRSFAAWDGDTIVGGGNLFLHGEIGVLNAGVTLESHRNRGVQSALIAARAEAAREAGCRSLAGEAFYPETGEHNPSRSNMLRAGLTLQYVRHDWVWRNPKSA